MSCDCIACQDWAKCREAGPAPLLFWRTAVSLKKDAVIVVELKADFMKGPGLTPEKEGGEGEAKEEEP